MSSFPQKNEMKRKDKKTRLKGKNKEWYTLTKAKDKIQKPKRGFLMSSYPQQNKMESEG